jgi:hypothetical protein
MTLRARDLAIKAFTCAGAGFFVPIPAMKNHILFILTALLTFTLPVASAWAWGGRGHHSLCDAATHLVKDPSLKEFLTARPQVMGHLCNVPDIFWKSQSEAMNSIGSPTHYVNTSSLQGRTESVSLDYRALMKLSSLKNFPKEFGSLWWRGDQFFRRAVDAGAKIKSSALPKGFKEEQDEKLPYNQAVFEFYVNLGIMGHFFGDASMPYHSSDDYDGYGTGHGGIHGYYEDIMVDAQDIDLVVKIRDEGLALQKKKSAPDFLTKDSVFESLRALTQVSGPEKTQIEALDPVLKKSEKPGEDGNGPKTRAERKKPQEVAKLFLPLMVKEMGRSAAALAHAWDMAYEKIGRPDLSAYRSYRYPFTPEFVPPDYYDVTASQK